MVVMIPLAVVAALYVDAVMPNNQGQIQPLFFFLKPDFWRDCFGMEREANEAPEEPKNLDREHISVKHETLGVLENEKIQAEAEGVRIVGVRKIPC